MKDITLKTILLISFIGISITNINAQKFNNGTLGIDELTRAISGDITDMGAVITYQTRDSFETVTVFETPSLWHSDAEYARKILGLISTTPGVENLLPWTKDNKKHTFYSGYGFSPWNNDEYLYAIKIIITENGELLEIDIRYFGNY